LKVETGDLIYIPSGVALCKFTDKDTISDFVKLEKPTNLLVVNLDGDLCEVLYEASSWWVRSREVYKNAD
jgi:hypothetical protein